MSLDLPATPGLGELISGLIAAAVFVGLYALAKRRFTGGGDAGSRDQGLD